LIYFLRSNPFFSQAIGFKPIANFVLGNLVFLLLRSLLILLYLEILSLLPLKEDYAFPLLHKTIDLLNLHGFNLLADAAYDSHDVYDFVHLETDSIAFIPLKISSKKPLVGDCGNPLSLHSHYFESNKYVCDDPYVNSTHISNYFSKIQ